MYIQDNAVDDGLGIFGLKKILGLATGGIISGGGKSSPEKAYQRILNRQAKTARIAGRDPQSSRIEKRYAKTARIAERAGLTLPCPTCEPLFPDEPAPPTVAPQPPHTVTAPQSMVKPVNVVSVPATQQVPDRARYAVNLPAPISPTSFSPAGPMPTINITTPGGTFQPATPEAEPESGMSKWLAPAGILAAVTVFVMLKKRR